MLKKRLIFTLLNDRGQFMLSRNFRLQKIGNLHWLETNYDFSRIAFSIDELIVLDVSRAGRDRDAFCDMLKALTRGCFVPIAAGGGVRTVAHAKQLLRSGADKVVINTTLADDPQLVAALAAEFGQQCLVGSMDIRSDRNGDYQVWVENGTRAIAGTLSDALTTIGRLPVGELYLNSIDRDGTGQGYDAAILDCLPEGLSVPIILAGGVGNARHLAEGLIDPRVDAAATAHLLNFVGDGLQVARRALTEQAGIDLAIWPEPSPEPARAQG